MIGFLKCGDENLTLDKINVKMVLTFRTSMLEASSTFHERGHLMLLKVVPVKQCVI